MNEKNDKIVIEPNSVPRVLFLGNGLLRLSNGANWNDLLNKISGDQNHIDVDDVPYAMQPEALCGVDVDNIQRRTADNISDVTPHPLLKELLTIPFDAVLTTNYTYEIETILSGKEWTKYRREKSFRILYGSAHVRHNTFVCNLVDTPDGREIPVFHIHGERERKHSMVLSYYSYANAMYRLIDYNRLLGDGLYDAQADGTDLEIRCWLDYFLLGEVYAVGFGFDTSEFDVWWAVERKAREHAEHGKLTVFMEDDPLRFQAQRKLFRAMDVNGQYIPVAGSDYEEFYREILHKFRNGSDSAE